MICMTIALVAHATSPTAPRKDSMRIEVYVQGERERAVLTDGQVYLQVPEHLSDFRRAWQLGIARPDGEPVVRFAGQFLVWSNEDRVRWLLGETRVSEGTTRLWVMDRNVEAGTDERCLFATGSRISARKRGANALHLRTELTVRHSCSAPPPPMDCSSPSPTARVGRGLVRLPEGGGLLDPVMNGETSAQERGWIQPVVANALHRAARATLCTASDRGWPGTGWPVVVGDRSQRDGSIPTWQGVPAHPTGSHTNGWDADVAYFQAGWAPDNDMRPVCVHADGEADRRHCLQEPVLLDARRTALFVGLLAEERHVRCVGVDGRVATELLEAQAQLVVEGVLREVGAKLCFEPYDEGRGWFFGHHDHLHVQGQRP